LFLRRYYSIFSVIFLCAAALSAALSTSAAQTDHHSIITIKVFKSGIFSGFAHNHIVVAPIAKAEINAEKLTAEITVSAKEMKVTDPEVSEKDRTEIQSTMLGLKVLDSERFPEIHFKSTRIEQTSPQHYQVMGILDLHGANHEVVLEVTGNAEHYHGTGKLKQSDFGIKPISLGGGSIKVKDELELEFDVYAATPAGH
jgi:polyisoprenoid-binding protein YceI